MTEQTDKQTNRQTDKTAIGVDPPLDTRTCPPLVFEPTPPGTTPGPRPPGRVPCSVSSGGVNTNTLISRYSDSPKPVSEKAPLLGGGRWARREARRESERVDLSRIWGNGATTKTREELTYRRRDAFKFWSAGRYKILTLILSGGFIQFFGGSGLNLFPRDLVGFQ